MPIRITSKQNGFHRCGMPHSSTPTIYPDKKFTPEQLEILKAEPMLIVDEISESGSGSSGKSNPSPVGSLNAKDAIKQIDKLSFEELKQVIATDDRSTVRQAASERILPELQKQLAEAQQLQDSPEKEKTIAELTNAIKALSGQS